MNLMNVKIFFKFIHLHTLKVQLDIRNKDYTKTQKIM